ncbi:hypothetical protein F5Y12DRAFT_783750 [Xylaria sp. FL1777]|nr:hypothetical protein F5Y12DRAFT_783750 [Xylaria sp. FL1777]
MSISIRDSIRWLPDEPASEPTSTVVLTSPEHRFVDIRILKGINEPDASLDWAFAGTSSSETRDGVRHCVWRHAVDSRTRTPEAVVDEGDIFPQDDGRTLETGRMVNPATGQMTSYEEVWSDLEAEGIPDEVNQQQRARCVVLELEDEERDERGMVVCLGRYCQGVVRTGSRFAAERWLWEDGEWQQKFRIGDLRIPGPSRIHTDIVSGKEQTGSEDPLLRWKVVEMSYQ